MFDSWMGERAVAYRRINRIPDDWGTAVNVQQMVFGNKGDTSRLGRRVQPRRGHRRARAQRATSCSTPRARTSSRGVRTPRDIARAARRGMPEVHAQLMEILRTLERHYGDMQDTEFTVEEGRLYMLQTRNAKRPAQAAVRFAVDAVERGPARRASEALLTIDAEQLDALLHPTFDPDARLRRCSPRGVAASPGAAKGEIVFTAADAVAAGGEGRDVILVRPFTEADDVAGFHAARGILTSEGGKASHAALVARGMGVPGRHRRRRARRSTSRRRSVRVGDTRPARGRPASRSTARPGDDHDRRRAARRARDHRASSRPCWAGPTSCAASACARTPTRPRTRARAREFGAEGIGLCRTEHMFLGETASR